MLLDAFILAATRFTEGYIPLATSNIKASKISLRTCFFRASCWALLNFSYLLAIDMTSLGKDLRRAFKSMAMKFKKPTQILLETTTGLTTKTRKLDHKSVIAWNLFAGLYSKVDGLPWGPVGLPQDSCFIGISFFRPLGQNNTLRTSVIQAFDENGEGLVLRGHDFHWDDKEGKSPHLSEELAGKLIEMVLHLYKEERKGQIPQRVVVHKTSRYEPAELAGFEAALSKVSQYDLVALSPRRGRGRGPRLRPGGVRS
jgi:hypothetical protein